MTLEYCMTVMQADANGEPVAELMHMHAPAESQDQALLVLLQACIKENINLKGCRIVVATEAVLPEGLLRYAEEARVMNHGSATPAPVFMAPGSNHVH